MNNFSLSHAAQIVVHADAEALAAAVAQRIASIIKQAITARGSCRIALAGGSTPRRCYEILRDMSIDWTQVYIYFGDERCLPIGDKERNDTMAQAALLKHVQIPAANIKAIPAELGAQAAAASYSKLFANGERLDLVLLGLGEDGHTASLFPGNPALQSITYAVAVYDAPKPPPERVSLSMAVINAAQHKIFMVAGAGKRWPLAAIAHGEPLPAGEVKNAEWHMDRVAVPT